VSNLPANPQPPVNPYDAYAQQQAQPQGQYPPPPAQYQQPQSYNANPPQFGTGRAQGQAPRNIGKTIRLAILIVPVAFILAIIITFVIIQIVLVPNVSSLSDITDSINALGGVTSWVS